MSFWLQRKNVHSFPCSSNTKKMLKLLIAFLCVCVCLKLMTIYFSERKCCALFIYLSLPELNDTYKNYFFKVIFHQSKYVISNLNPDWISYSVHHKHFPINNIKSLWTTRRLHIMISKCVSSLFSREGVAIEKGFNIAFHFRRPRM